MLPDRRELRTTVRGLRVLAGAMDAHAIKPRIIYVCDDTFLAIARELAGNTRIVESGPLACNEVRFRNRIAVRPICYPSQVIL
jgi:hypothetical protein